MAFKVEDKRKEKIPAIKTLIKDGVLTLEQV